MKRAAHIEGPFRGGARSPRSPLAEEAMYACGGLAVVVYLCYAFFLG